MTTPAEFRYDLRAVQDVEELDEALSSVITAPASTLEAAPTAGDRWKVVRDAFKDLRLERCLRAEVKQLLAKPRAPFFWNGRGESEGDRLGRLEDFFSEFKLSPSRTEARKAAAVMGDDDEASSAGSTPRSSDPTSPTSPYDLKRLSNAKWAAAPVLVGGGKLSKASRNALNWKDRAGRSRRSSGTWSRAASQREGLTRSASSSCIFGPPSDHFAEELPRHSSVARRLVALKPESVQVARGAMPSSPLGDDPLQERIFNRAVRRAISAAHLPLGEIDAGSRCCTADTPSARDLSQSALSPSAASESGSFAFENEDDEHTSHSPEKLPPKEIRGPNAVKLPIIVKGSFWDRSHEMDPEKRVPATHVRRYHKECAESKIVPQVLPFATGHSNNLCAPGRGLLDRDLRAMLAAMSRGGFSIDSVDLSDNPMLTDNTMASLLDFALSARSLSRLESVNIKSCRGIGEKTLERVVDVLKTATGQTMTYLNISGLHLGPSMQQALCTAIGEHQALKHVHIADTGICGERSVDRVSSLLGNSMIEELDLGWNCFSGEAFEAMGKLLDGPTRLRALGIANTSASSDPTGTRSPIAHLVERLADNEGLTHLDISLNRLDFRDALVIEDAFCKHRRMVELNVSDNPIGVLGLRSLIRLLLENTSGLLRFKWETCFSDIDRLAGSRPIAFNNAFPSGRYRLDLKTPHDRALLRMLCKTCARLGVAVQDVITDVTMNPGPYEAPSLGSYGTWTVPSSGILTFMCSIERRLGQGFKDKWAFGPMVRRYLERAKPKPGFRKLVHLLSMWQSMKARTPEQHMMLRALAGEFQLAPFHVRQLCRNREVRSDVLCQLLTSVQSFRSGRFLTLLAAPSQAALVNALHENRNVLFLNVDNPTGHYHLDLSRPADFTTAGQLVLLDRWEAKVANDLGRIDTSQRGNASCFRNETYQEAPLLEASVRHWVLPEHGSLVFDYATGFRQRRKGKVVDETVLESILSILGKSSCSPSKQIAALRAHAHLLTLKVAQLRQLLCAYETDALRAEIYVLLFFRVADIENEKALRACLLDPSLTYPALEQRLGYAALFPYVQPERFQFEYDLQFNDQRLAAHAVTRLCAKEKWDSLKESDYTSAPGGLDQDSFWQAARDASTFEKMPAVGVMKGMYLSSSKDRRMADRLQLRETYSFWSADIPEDRVQWWSSLSEIASDVVVFVEWFLPRYEQISSAFDDIQAGVPDPGVSTNGELQAKEFEAGLLAIQFGGFKGGDEKQRLAGVFKFLDISGEGIISRHDWCALESVQREAVQSMKELVGKLSRNCLGGPASWWQALVQQSDSDGEHFDLDAWTSACKRLGFFGSARHAFKFMDLEEQGWISEGHLRRFGESSARLGKL